MIPETKLEVTTDLSAFIEIVYIDGGFPGGSDGKVQEEEGPLSDAFMKGQYGRPAKRDRQRERDRGQERVSLPHPHPEASPTPRPALDVQAAFSQGAHSAKLDHSLKPSDHC